MDMINTQFTPQNYQQQLDEKVARFRALFCDFDLPELTVVSSPLKHYRMRAEFRVWHNGDELYHIMFDKQTRRRFRVDSFPIAAESINQAMALIIKFIQYNQTLREKLFQIDYLATLSNNLLISLLYHKKLTDEWRNEANKLKTFFAQQGLDVTLVGRASNQKICLPHDFVDEELAIQDRKMIYRQVENSFTQPNAYINIEMLNWALAVTKHCQNDLLELYCGNGNFSLALAKNFRQVLATEVAKASVQAAQYNIEVNQIDNVKIVRLSAEELTEAINGVRTFNRLKGVNLADYCCNTVLVDPPRSGLDPQTLAMIANYHSIIYISCNPTTLKSNLMVLKETHNIANIALFDQFPYTAHIECGMVLTKKLC